MTFLDAWGFVGRRANAVVHCIRQLAPGRPGQSHGVQPDFFRRRHPVEDVRRLAASRNPDCHIAAVGQSLELPREYQIKAVVIADRSDTGSVYRECQSWQGWTIKRKTSYKLRRDVLRVRRASAITKENDLAPSSEGIDQEFAYFSDSGYDFHVL